jgi:hypothetical protein
VAQCHGWARINDVRLSRFSLVSDHAVYRLSLIGHLAPSLGHLDARSGSLIVAATARIRGLLCTMFNSIDTVFSLPPLSIQMKISGRTSPGLSRIMQFGSGRFVVKDGMVTVTASDGRTTKGVIEDSMLSPERIAKTLPLQLHRMGKRQMIARALRPRPPTCRNC